MNEQLNTHSQQTADLFEAVRAIQEAKYQTFLQFSAGMDLFRLGHSRNACANGEQLNGWNAANKAEALARMPDEYQPEPMGYENGDFIRM